MENKNTYTKNGEVLSEREHFMIDSALKNLNNKKNNAPIVLRITNPFSEIIKDVSLFDTAHILNDDRLFKTECPLGVPYREVLLDLHGKNIIINKLALYAKEFPYNKVSDCNQRALIVEKKEYSSMICQFPLIFKIKKDQYQKNVSQIEMTLETLEISNLFKIIVPELFTKETIELYIY